MEEQHPAKEIMGQLIASQWQQHSIFAAVVDPQLHVIAVGRTTVQTDHDPTAHAEVNAIRQACAKLGCERLPPGYWLYSTFEPCPLCAAAAIWAGIDGIVYANDPCYRGQEADWSFISCETVLAKGRSIHPVTLIKNFMLPEIKDYFTRHEK